MGQPVNQFIDVWHVNSHGVEYVVARGPLPPIGLPARYHEQLRFRLRTGYEIMAEARATADAATWKVAAVVIAVALVIGWVVT